MRLLNTHTLTITRLVAGSGYQDPVTKKWVDGTQEAPFDISCSIQPFRNGKEQIKLPEHINSKDVRIVYTKTELYETDEFAERKADTTVIGGLEFECFRVEPWTGFNLSTDHYKCLFIRKDKLKGSP